MTIAVSDLADAIRAGAVQAGADSPQVRGADWQTAVVTAVGTGGTVTAGGIAARRMASYESPAVGDLIYLTNSSSGNWLAVGPVAPSSTAGTWQPLTLASGWTPWGSPYWTPSYRINGDGTCSLSGLAKAPAGVTVTTTVTTLPAAATPASKARFAGEVAAGVYGSLDINTNGTVQITDFTGTAGWASFDVARYRLI